MTDQEIAGFLTPLKYVAWETWQLPERRGWYNNAKTGAAKYALVTKDNKTLEILSGSYLQNLGQQIWLESAESNK